jgi:pimeloyl-ACP methyl ester carboxylesterase
MPTRPPIVFIPGFPASELRTPGGHTIFPPPSPQTLADPVKRRKFMKTVCDLNQLVAGPPILHVLEVAKQAESLYDILKGYGYATSDPSQFAPIGWDWRRPVDDPLVLDAAEKAIRDFAAAGTKPVVITHSTGGLVFRRLIELRPGVASKIAHVLAFAIPWAGTLKAFLYLSNGEPFGFLAARLDEHEAREVMSHAAAGYDLLPPPSAADAAGDDVPPPLVFNNKGAGVTDGRCDLDRLGRRSGAIATAGCGLEEPDDSSARFPSGTFTNDEHRRLRCPHLDTC